MQANKINKIVMRYGTSQSFKRDVAHPSKRVSQDDWIYNAVGRNAFDRYRLGNRAWGRTRSRLPGAWVIHQATTLPGAVDRGGGLSASKPLL